MKGWRQTRRGPAPVLDLLGLPVPQDRELKTTHQRQADRVNEEWVRAYRSR